jgi:hypothetical protein
MWVSTTSKLHVKRYAERRTPDPEKMNALLIYIIMSRLETQQSQELSSIEYKTEYIQECNDKKELAYFIKGHVKTMEEHYKVQEREITNREANVERFSKDLARLGITWNPEIKDWQDTNRVENEINLLKNQIDNNTLWKMRATGKEMVELAERIELLRKVD